MEPTKVGIDWLVCVYGLGERTSVLNLSESSNDLRGVRAQWVIRRQWFILEGSKGVMSYQTMMVYLWRSKGTMSHQTTMVYLSKSPNDCEGSKGMMSYQTMIVYPWMWLTCNGLDSLFFAQSQFLWYCLFMARWRNRRINACRHSGSHMVRALVHAPHGLYL